MNYTYNIRPADCGNPTHAGFEVIEWPTDWVEDCTVVAVARDEETAAIIAEAMWRQATNPCDGQLTIDGLALIDGGAA